MDHNEFDALLRDRGWYYDNGWSHDDTYWDCYISDDSASINEYFVILSKKGNGRCLKITKTPSQKQEIWAGPLSSVAEINTLIAFIESQVVQS